MYLVGYGCKSSLEKSLLLINELESCYPIESKFIVSLIQYVSDNNYKDISIDY